MDERELTADFADFYRRAQTAPMLAIERAVFGSDYGASSWTTRDEATRVGELLALAPGRSLLEVGAGSGWPGLYLARETGCDVTLVDLPLDGLRIAADRAVADRLAHACRIVVAGGGALPFPAGRFDAVSHADVLCCLDDKAAVLGACRRVVRPGGRMAFTVISIAPGLAAADRARAIECGPPFAATPVAYPTMLGRAGWALVDRIDLTAEYEAAHHRLLEEEQARADQLTELLGAAGLSERLAGRRTAIGVIAAGLLRRELFVATPAEDPADLNDR